MLAASHRLEKTARQWDSRQSSYWLVVFVATMRSATMRFATMPGCGMGSTVGRATARCCGMGVTVGRATARRCGMGGTTAGLGTAAGAHGRCATSAIGCISPSTAVSTAFDVDSSAAAAEAMLTPAVAIAPVRPRAHAQEDAAIEIAGSIIAHGCASVRRIAVVAVGTDGRS